MRSCRTPWSMPGRCGRRAGKIPAPSAGCTSSCCSCCCVSGVSAMSAEPAWRVYLPEWLAVYTAGYMGDPGEQECRKYFARKYGGRVRDEDWRVRPGGPDGWPVLEVRLPNLRG